MKKWFLIVLYTLMLSACLVMGDSAAKVSGQVFDENRLAYSNCSIDLFVVKDAAIQTVEFSNRQINFNGSRFEQLFIISPQRLNYLVEVGCDGSNDIYRSKPFPLGSKDGLSHPVDLGEIILHRHQ